MVLSLTVTDTPAAEDLSAIGDGLSSFNAADVGPAERWALAVVVHDETGQVVAGISGYTAWGWLYVQWLWVAEGARGGGLAGRILAAAETEGRARGCHGAPISTRSARWRLRRTNGRAMPPSASSRIFPSAAPALSCRSGCRAFAGQLHRTRNLH